MKFKIKIEYETGNSFSIYDETDYIGYEWKNLEMAKESLQRIKNHYKYYQDNNWIYEKPKDELPKGVVWDDEWRMLILELVDDDGKPFNYSSFWTGYFETLHCARIVSEDHDLIYNP